MSEPHDSIAAAAACEHVELVLDSAPLLRAAWPTAEERAAASLWFDPSMAVPFALDESGRRVLAAHRPDRESPGHSYACPFCDGAVTLRESARLVRKPNCGPIQRRRVIETAKTLALTIPPGYTAHRWYCHECREPMLVFSWFERREGKAPPVPRPPGLEHCDGSGWSQHCPHCSWEQTLRWRRRDEAAPARDL